ncbi:MAG: hypothetical protein F4Z08_04955 [Chloroflexi bacterium]|nr:hypothetical protein [Chloroflexota bacterium]
MSLVLAACGGSGEEASDAGPAATPAPTQAPAATPTAQPTATAQPAAADEATGDDDETTGDEATADDEASPTPAATQAASDASEAEATPTAGPTAPPVDVVEQIRERTEAMWEVYNSHDADALAAFYEPSYWKAEEEEVRANMRPFRNFGISIRPEETSPPTEIAPGQWEIRQTGHFPLGSVKLAFVWQEFDGVWLLIHTEAE